MFNEYGENDFLITYDDIYYFSFRQFKTSTRNQHDYSFYFYENNDTVYIKADIVGISNMKFVRPMNLISNASKLKCNGNIDKNKTTYNMIEMVYPK